MKTILSQMIQIYKPVDRDWMHFKITEENKLTYHHICKQESGGEENIENGAILTKNAHELLHCIERKNIKFYIEINKLFKEINKKTIHPGEGNLNQIKELVLKYLELGYPTPKKLKVRKIKKLIL